MFYFAQARASSALIGRGLLLLSVAVALCGGRSAAEAAAAGVDLEAGRKAFESGQYEECIALARQALKAKAEVEDWGTLLADALMMKGRYAEALTAANDALTAEPRSIRLRWSARQALLANGKPTTAQAMTAAIQEQFSNRYWSYRNARDLAVFGQVALVSGMEPKLVLDRIYAAAKKADAKCPEPYLASGHLALEKHDFGLAARYFQEGLEQLPGNPDLQLGLARAYAPSDQGRMVSLATQALERNSNHVGSLLLLADHNIDAEDYGEAEKLLARVDAVNPTHPEAWAYRAVLAHLRNQPKGEATARGRALKSWGTNPRVDYLIGLKLSRKYRFNEGARCQRRALAFDPDYLPAKGQLAEDLLRLGEEEEGWRLADEVQQADGYDVAANNLATLRDVLAKYQTLTSQHFILRMHPREGALYGRRALELLERARTRLCPSYGVEFSRPVLVELFHEEKDFAVRTFGMPDNDGFLGVCFGHVITANSPGARPGSQFNWESMLWHEFCHAVTLQLTRNKMPRWVSEGISVYEERQANPAWGERLSPQYREMLLGKELTRVSKLSGAFLGPKSGRHLQFAYYESSLVIQFLVERFGREQLLNILRDLGQGVDVNNALASHTVPMAQLEKDFKAFAQKTAKDMAPGVDWEKPAATLEITTGGRSRQRGSANVSSNALAAIPESAWEAWAKERPTNYWVLLRKAELLTDEKKWPEARPLLQTLVELYPDATGSSSPYRRLAIACRELGDTNAERQVLTRFAEKDDEAPDAYLRLMDLANERADWAILLTNAQRYLAINPLVPAPYRFLAKASEARGDVPVAIEAYRALLQLDPPNPADVHFHLAELLHRQRDPEARRHVLEALEEAPRFREGLRLFRQMRQEAGNATSETSATLE